MTEVGPVLDALVAAPDHHRVRLENEHVRALDTKLRDLGRSAAAASRLQRGTRDLHILASEFKSAPGKQVM